MDRKPIYIEKDDEITTVVDRLKNIDAADLEVVIPKEATMLQSVINLKLLKKQAEALGKEIIIVTQDKVGAKLAQQIGIPVVAKEGQIPKEVSVTESEEPKYSEDDIQIKEAGTQGEDAPSTVRKSANLEERSDGISDEPPTEKVTSKGGWFKKHRKLVLIGGGATLILLVVAAYIYVPLANISIKLVAEKKQVNLDFTASKNTTSVDIGKGLIPAREIVKEVQKSENFQGTGEREVGERASGRVKVCNQESNNSLNLVAGTRVVDQAGLGYTTQANIQVPGATVSGGKVVESCSAEVAVRAEQVGERHNKPQPGIRFSIPALQGAFRAESTTAITGGTSRKVRFVTAGDIEKAKSSVKNSAESELEAKVNESVGEAILLEGALETEEVSATSSVAAGAETESFTFNMKLRGIAFVIFEGDLKSLAEGKLKEEIGENKEIVETGALIPHVKITELNIEEGEFRASLSGEAYIATKIKEDEIKRAISGNPGKEAISYLNEIEGVEAVEIKFFPEFYSRIPRLNNHIYIKTEIVRPQAESE